eukprot:gene1451-841_t
MCRCECAADEACLWISVRPLFGSLRLALITSEHYLFICHFSFKIKFYDREKKRARIIYYLLFIIFIFFSVHFERKREDIEKLIETPNGKKKKKEETDVCLCYWVLVGRVCSLNVV